MEFIDNYGYVFSLPSFEEKPIQFEKDINKYIFWLENNNSNRLSIKNYYFKSIKFIIDDYNYLEKLNINIESDIFRIFGNKQLYELYNSNDDICLDKLFYTSFEENNIDYRYPRNQQSINIDDLNVYEVTENGKTIHFIEFFVCGYAESDNTWLSNILIELKYKKQDKDDDFYTSFNYCYITVGGEFVEECEELVINSQNMGVYLPKDILRAVYQSNFYNIYPEEDLYNKKVKELLLNYAGIKIEQGNFNSAIKSLKWFGWGDKLTIYNLIKNENLYINQYILDNFSITNDISKIFKKFKKSNLISIYLKENQYLNELDNNEEFNFNENFWGENLLKRENLFNKKIDEIYHIERLEDSSDNTNKNFNYQSNYYEYLESHLALKLAALKYYYEKYFLPIHIQINNISTIKYCQAPDLKLISNSYTSLFNGLYLNGKTIKPSFNNEREMIFLTTEPFNYDEHFIISDEHNNGRYDLKGLINIKINEISDIYNCVLKLVKIKNNKEKILYTDYFSILNSQLQNNIIDINNSNCVTVKYDEDKYYLQWVLNPRELTSKFSNFKIDTWVDELYQLSININGIWYYYSFILNLPKLNIEVGKLDYIYDDRFRQINFMINKNENLVTQTSKDNLLKEEDDYIIKFNQFMYNEDLVLINNLYIDWDIDHDTINYNNIIDVSSANNIEFSPLLSKQYKDFYNLLGNKNDILNRKKFLNKIYYYDLEEEYQNLSYDDFFDENGMYKSRIIKINSNYYDFYLMKNPLKNNKKYCVFISKFPDADSFLDENGIPQKPILANGSEVDPAHPIPLINEKINYMFLINRYKYKSFNDYEDNFLYKRPNQFYLDDIICTRIINNNNIPFILRENPKWNFEYLTADENLRFNVSSKANYGLFSMDPEYDRHKKGYYSVKVYYSIDNTSNITYQITGKFMILGDTTGKYDSYMKAQYSTNKEEE